ncbi:TetR/AcrR family transcriptional regulator [bacterium]|nr:TetR/AcrR family transcriptional regulator [bacterium]
MDQREKLYKKALALFNSRGYDNTSVSQIAKALNLSKASLYHYMSSKQHLLFLIYENYLERHFIPIFESAEKISDPNKRLTFVIQSLAKLAATEPSVRVLVHESRRLDNKYHKEIKIVWGRAFQVIRDAITELQSSKKAKKLNSAFAAFAVMGMTSFIFYWYDYKRKASAEELSKTLLEIFLKGLLTGKDL